MEKKDIYVTINWDEDDIGQAVGYQYNSDGDEQSRPEQFIAKLQDYIGEFTIAREEIKQEKLIQLKNRDMPSNVRKKILESTITIVLLTPNQKDAKKFDGDQWLPYEIETSLTTDQGRLPNGIIYVILPDKSGDVEYAYSYSNDITNLGLYDTKFDLYYFHYITISNTYNRVNKKSNEGQDITFDSYISIYDWDEFLRHFDTIIENARLKRVENYKYNLNITVERNGMFNKVKKLN